MQVVTSKVVDNHDNYYFQKGLDRPKSHNNALKIAIRYGELRPLLKHQSYPAQKLETYQGLRSLCASDSLSMPRGRLTIPARRFDHHARRSQFLRLVCISASPLPFIIR